MYRACRYFYQHLALKGNFRCSTYFGRCGLRSRWMMEVSVRKAADLISTRVGSLSSSSWTSSSRMPGQRRLWDSALEQSRTDSACRRACTHLRRRLWLENECANRKCVNSIICKQTSLSHMSFYPQSIRTPSIKHGEYEVKCVFSKITRCSLLII